jgi:hypothetical protein
LAYAREQQVAISLVTTTSTRQVTTLCRDFGSGESFNNATNLIAEGSTLICGGCQLQPEQPQDPLASLSACRLGPFRAISSTRPIRPPRLRDQPVHTSTTASTVPPVNVVLPPRTTAICVYVRHAIDRLSTEARPDVSASPRLAYGCVAAWLQPLTVRQGNGQLGFLEPPWPR